MTGCEGYVESASIGLIAGLYAAADARGAVAAAAAGDHGAGIAARPYHRRPHRNDRRRHPLVPADEHQFRAVPAACEPPTKKADGTRLRGNEKTVAKKQAISARALADLDRWIADHLRIAAAA